MLRAVNYGVEQERIQYLIETCFLHNTDADCDDNESEGEKDYVEGHDENPKSEQEFDIDDRHCESIELVFYW